MMGSFLATWLCWLGLFCPNSAPDGPDEAAKSRSPAISADSAALETELDRLRGHEVTRIERAGALTGYVIDSVASAGPPLVGQVRAREALELVTERQGVYRLAGPLARKRIAGPGYKVWVLGDIRPSADGSAPDLYIRRIGVLAPP